MHHDARWYAAPGQFMPERWTPDFEKSLPKSAYLPFGNGPRVCIGNGFATLEMALVLAAIAGRFALSLAPGSALQPSFGLTLGFKNPVRMRLAARL
jgi:cytochrome P450